MPLLRRNALWAFAFLMGLLFECCVVSIYNGVYTVLWSRQLPQRRSRFGNNGTISLAPHVQNTHIVSVCENTHTHLQNISYNHFTFMQMPITSLGAPSVDFFSFIRICVSTKRHSSAIRNPSRYETWTWRYTPATARTSEHYYLFVYFVFKFGVVFVVFYFCRDDANKPAVQITPRYSIVDSEMFSVLIRLTERCVFWMRVMYVWAKT